MIQASMFNRRKFVQLAGGAVAAGLLPADALAAPAEESLPLPNIWGFGQLMAFSGIDGITDYKSGLVARTLENPLGIEIMLPERAMLSFGTQIIGRAQLTNDSFVLTTENGEVRGAFVAAFHLLCDGPVKLDHLSPSLQAISKGSLTLIGAGTL